VTTHPRPLAYSNSPAANDVRAQTGAHAPRCPTHAELKLHHLREPTEFRLRDLVARHAHIVAWTQTSVAGSRLAHLDVERGEGPQTADEARLDPTLCSMKHHEKRSERPHESADAGMDYRDMRIADLELLERAARARVEEMAQRLAVVEGRLGEALRELELTESRLDESAQQLERAETRLDETAQELVLTRTRLETICATRGWRTLERYWRIRTIVRSLRPRRR
jgi:hypothetical protein